VFTSIAFTICSINYLSQAITLGNSLKSSNPEVEFRIYLVDKLAGRETVIDTVPFSLIEIEKVPIADFKGMCIRYNIVELNTSVKPFIIEHIFNNETHVKNVIYFDPDIIVFGSLKELLNNLQTNTIVLTPHILCPCDDHPFGQSERNYLIAGTFNLGFIGVSRQEETFDFLKWWQDRLVHQGYGNNAMHLFFDQKWLNLALIFFQNVYIEKNPGYNMAGWNLHERVITEKSDGKYIINHKHELAFYHFSGVKLQSDDVSTYSKYSFEERPDLKEIIDVYRRRLRENRSDFYASYRCYYSQFYKGPTIYYPRYHWITLYRRTRVNLGKIKKMLSKTIKLF
jgi:lipopolysaccharide biosynthesis glycosyltransferase